MKIVHSATLFLLVSLTIAAAQKVPALLSDPPDGSKTLAPEPRATFKPAVVEETTVTRDGNRNIIVQRLAPDPNDPILPVAKPTPAPTQPSPPADNIAAPPAHLLLISATVHPGPATKLSWTHNFPNGTAKEYSGWSNINWNHLNNINTFLGTDGGQHSFVLAVANEPTPAEGAPAFASEAPTFLPDQADVPAEALITVDSLHKLYALEHEKLAAAHAGRQRAEAARAAELLANPPQPKDLIIRYRIAETPVEPQAPVSR